MTGSRSIPTTTTPTDTCCGDDCCGGTADRSSTTLADGADVRANVREKYGEIARGEQACGCGCGCTDTDVDATLRTLGYGPEQAAVIPAEANLGLGCGNPIAHAALRPGEVVLDLGSGGGIDCFLAASEVGPSGRAIGVDMTPSMIERARATATRHGIGNVEFRLGEIEQLPVADDSVDVIVSNCVVNLSPDKPRVFREALRVLRPGGRLVVSDLVLTRELDEAERRNVDLLVGCVAGALQLGDYLGCIRDAGFADVEVVSESSYDIGTSSLPPDSMERRAFEAVRSVKVRATKIAGTSRSSGRI